MQGVCVNPMHIHACGSGIGPGHFEGVHGPFVSHDLGMGVPAFMANAMHPDPDTNPRRERALRGLRLVSMAATSSSVSGRE